MHGDYRLDNMIFHATEPRVQAVLDWELSTLGDPMADFTYLLMQWTMPGLDGADFKALNIPSMEEAAQIYCNVTGTAVPDLNWYFSYNLFRLAGITQGIAGRIRDGTAANAKAMEFRQAHGAAVEGVLGIRAEGRRTVSWRRAAQAMQGVFRLDQGARLASNGRPQSIGLPQLQEITIPIYPIRQQFR